MNNIDENMDQDMLFTNKDISDIATAKKELLLKEAEKE